MWCLEGRIVEAWGRVLTAREIRGGWAIWVRMVKREGIETDRDDDGSVLLDGCFD